MAKCTLAVLIISFALLFIDQFPRIDSCNGDERRCRSVLNGRHLVIASIQSLSGIMTRRNASGHVLSASGIPVPMLEWLAKEYNFTFSYLPTNVTIIDGAPPGQMGLIDYITRGEVDIVLPLIATTSRLALVDFVHPYLYIPISYLIPFGNPYANAMAVSMPFQPLVWIGTVLTTAIVIVFFYSISRKTRWQSNFISDNVRNSMHVDHSYVLAVLLNQGSHCHSPRLSIRLAAGCWCLACLVLINSYSSVLISYLTLSNPNLLINSIEELKDHPDVYLVTDKGLSTDITLTASSSGLLKTLGDKLKSYPKSRCNATQECIQMVKAGSHVYTSGVETYLTKAMREDYLLTKKCNFRLGKDFYMDLDLSWAAAKRSPFISELNHGLMRMREFGLITAWKRPYEADVSRCIDKAKEYPDNERLSLLHLTGAFTVLLVGFIISMVTFVIEICTGRRRFRRRK